MRWWGRLGRRMHRAALLFAVLGAVIGGLAVAGLTWWLLWLGLGAKAETPNQVDLTRIALSVTAGAGGAVALVVAYRRQRDLERGRFAELFGAAARQLGDDDPAVRLAGVYAMAGVADEFSAPVRRQQCVDVLCGYLRLPYEPDDGANHLISRAETAQESGREIERVYRIRHNDREVRGTIVRVIADHLRPYSEASWSRCDFDFTGGVLENADFEATEFGGRWTTFARARFVGDRFTDFNRARFTGHHVTFRDATFTAPIVNFENTEFRTARTTFDGVTFESPRTCFDEAKFAGAHTGFVGARFVGARTSWRSAAFQAELTSFAQATLDGERVSFEHAAFSGQRVAFTAAQLYATAVTFEEAELGAAPRLRRRTTREIDFVGAEFHGAVSFARSTIAGHTADFREGDFFGEISFTATRFTAGETHFDRPKAWVGVRFDWDDNLTRKPQSVNPNPWPPVPEGTPAPSA
ncbi:pentapeptide repeat-containing protein [Nocardia lijiangensis]|uniref:pentapeptide repeat-containing protein n=1 Tax=Nocardia lijiangensis TaxID=299618 RepID=UPI001FE01516|nr:pentapeptide repeat-containing protein [Nocardia lijiangensis]